MKIGKHRRHLPVRDFLSGLGLALLLWFNDRRPRKPWRSTPDQINELGMSLARLSWTAERVPLGVSYAEHAEGVRLIELHRTA